MRHSLSPVIHNAAFRALDLDWVYVAFQVAAGGALGAVAGARTLGIDGLSVTMPHKEAVIPALDQLSGFAEAVGAVNTIFRRGAALRGENTDGSGFVDSLVKDEGLDPAGRRCLVAGAGGAARAVVKALADAGAAEVVIVNRSAPRAVRAASLAPPVTRVGTAADAAKADLIVNATPLGMSPGDPLPLDPALVATGQLVVDLVYHPLVTPFVEAARARGAVAAGGLGTLIHQAARAFRLWTGEDPPLEVMSAAAVGQLVHREEGR